MDSTCCSSTERKPQPNGSEPIDRLSESNDVSALSAAADQRRLSNESILPASLEIQAHHLMEVNIAVVGANSELVPHFLVTDETGNASLVSHDVAGADENVPSEKQGQSEMSPFSGTDQLSTPGSEVDSESLKRITPDPDHMRSELELVGVGQSVIDEPNQDLIADSVTQDTCDEQAGWSSDKDSAVPEENEKEAVFAWKGSKFNKFEMSPRFSKAQTSEITDLGDRAFYANFNATDQHSTASLRLADGRALQGLFFESLAGVHDEKDGFFPKVLLSTLVNEDCVTKELTRTLSETHNPIQIQAYARRICEELAQPNDEDDNRPPKIKSFKKIFAILVLIGRTASISRFLEEDVNDLDLPLSKVKEDNNCSRFELRRFHKQDKMLECFRNWDPFLIRSFERYQWTTLSPFFHRGLRKDVQHFLLQNSVMLPFTADSRLCKDDETRIEINGGYGCVFKVDIHPDHHNFDLPKRKNQSFAVKQLNSPSKEDFKKEVKMLKMFSDHSHSHIISLLATYQQRKAFFLVFPWADGDLHKFWSTHMPKPSVDIKMVKWVASQCVGIVHALARIHEYRTSDLGCQSYERRYGRHGDIKPENILWYDDADGGVLKISDFGASGYSTTQRNSYLSRSSVPFSISYRPPERDIVGSKIGQSYDIWTLGCLYLEFITWLLGGWDLVTEFTNKRLLMDREWYCMRTDTFFTLIYPSSECPGPITAMVKPAVTNFIRQHLRAHPSCTEFLHKFLNTIEMDMLVVKPQTPNPKDPGRISSEQLCHQLSNLVKNCNDADFICPAPWHSYVKNSEEVFGIEADSAAAAAAAEGGVPHWTNFRQREGPSQVPPTQPGILTISGRWSTCHY